MLLLVLAVRMALKMSQEFLTVSLDINVPGISDRLLGYQGDGQKFLGHFKRHFGSQISSESLKQGHI